MNSLIDNFGRTLDYLRIAVTDRCNLRCHYCMPEEGIDFVNREELLDYEELIRLARLFVSLGTRKIRITGGEPFVRKDLLYFLKMLSEVEGLEEWNITTNGTNTYRYIPELKELGVHSVNLSLDTLNRKTFAEITRRDRLPFVLKTLDSLLENDISTKINCVVMPQVNLDDVVDMAALTLSRPVEMRFIEEMPFNGTSQSNQNALCTFHDIKALIETEFGALVPLETPANNTAILYRIPGAAGKIGIIPAFSRTICGSCNRLRLTPQGVIKTCLYDKGVFNMKKMLRSGASDEELVLAISEAVRSKARDGFEAEKLNRMHSGFYESMSTIGG